MRELLPWGGHQLYDRLVARPLARFYQRLAQDIPEGAVLDIGCGPGHLAAALHGMGREVVAIDKDPAQVRIAKRNHPGLDVRAGAAEALPFAARRFDVVVTSESFHHWSDPVAGVAEAFRVLRPGGRLVIIEGAGDVTKDEVRAFLGIRVPPGLTMITRWVFRTHGFTPAGLGPGLVDVVQAHAHVTVERIDGWWRITAQA